MYEIDIQEVSQDFARCWQAAGRHLDHQVQGGIRFWLKANLSPPFLEHLSFRLGNQLFFVRVEELGDRVVAPGTRRGLRSIAEGCQGHACLMLMRADSNGWSPVHDGWGLMNLETGDLIDPVSLVTDRDVEITDWELHDFAVQAVRQQLEHDGSQLISWQGNPGVDPSIWLQTERGPEWVVVRAARYPTRSAELPRNWAAIKQQASRMSRFGHFASVCFANLDETIDWDPQRPPLKLGRGRALEAMYDGLVSDPGGVDA